MKYKHESGRTMLEMIGVLVIIGLLTVGGMTGYSYLVQRHRRQEVAKEVAQLVLGIKTTGAARKYGEGAIIPAADFVPGLDTQQNGQVLKFADGENSYAVVTQLANGAFALNLQLEPGTCEVVMKALEDEDIVMFDTVPGKKVTSSDEMLALSEGTGASGWLDNTEREPLNGVKMHSNASTDADEIHSAMTSKKITHEHMVEICNEGLYTTWVHECTGGSSSYGNIYNSVCDQCPAGKMLDAKGKCCDRSAENCGNLCSCPNGQMCDHSKGGGTCVVCSTYGSQEKGNEQCKKVYNAFAKHVCYGKTNTCVECLTNDDCAEAIIKGHSWKDKATYVDKHFLACSDDFKCVECNMDFNGNKPGEVEGEYPCQDDTLPICKNGTCTTCPSDEQVWDPEKKKCVCKDGKHMNAAGQCGDCVDDRTGYGEDTGCTADQPVCYDPDADSATLEAFVKGGSLNIGTTCVECFKDSHCEQKNNKYCDPSTHTCRFCQDHTGGDNVDTRGCSDGALASAKRFCKPDGSPDNNPDNDSKKYGDACFVCRNNNYGDNNAQKDEGCSEDKKLCATADKTYANTCHVCQNDKEGATKDSGCGEGTWAGKNLCGAAQNAYADVCHVCQNDQTGEAKDSGCGAGDWAGKNLCGAAQNAYADVCYKCQDSVSGFEGPNYAKKDDGCPSNLPVCDVGENTASGKFANSCVECLTSADCPLSKYCDTTSKTCKPCNQAGTGARGTQDSETCECPPGYRMWFRSTTSTKKFGNGGSWECKQGCLQHTDCQEDYCCSCTGSGCDNVTGVCQTKEGWHRIQSSNEACAACKECETYNPETGHCESNCKEGEICMQVSGGSDPAICGGWKCQAVNCSNLYHMRGKIAGDFWMPWHAEKYKMTHPSAVKFCEACGMQLAGLDLACGKDYRYNSGHDCPNISGNKTFVDPERRTEYSLSSWNVDSGGSFWLADFARDRNALRVTYSCGNNHESHMCNKYYPLCTTK